MVKAGRVLVKIPRAVGKAGKSSLACPCNGIALSVRNLSNLDNVRNDGAVTRQDQAW